MAKLFLALGSNLGARTANLRAALAGLPPLVQVVRVSAFYETEPAYLTDQPRFINAVAEATTQADPWAVLAHTQAIEQALGRTAGGPRFGPRPVDVDLLWYEGVTLDTPTLTLPHPRWLERAFVLVPLADLVPDWTPPGQTAPVHVLARQAALGLVVRQVSFHNQDEHHR